MAEACICCISVHLAKKLLLPGVWQDVLGSALSSGGSLDLDELQIDLVKESMARSGSEPLQLEHEAEVPLLNKVLEQVSGLCNLRAVPSFSE